MSSTTRIVKTDVAIVGGGLHVQALHPGVGAQGQVCQTGSRGLR